MTNKFPGYIFREATYEDIPALAWLHAVAWKETYELIYPEKTDWPTIALREQQWRSLFRAGDKSWLC